MEAVESVILIYSKLISVRTRDSKSGMVSFLGLVVFQFVYKLDRNINFFSLYCIVTLLRKEIKSNSWLIFCFLYPMS